MKKRWLLLLLIIIIAGLVYLYIRPPPLPILSIDKVYGVNEIGKTLLVNVTLANAAKCGGWMIDVTWDPYYIKLTTGGPNSTRPIGGGDPVVLIEGPFLKDVGATAFGVNYADNSAGEALVTSIFPSGGIGASGTGILLMMNFTIVHVGTTTIEMKPPSPGYLNQSIIVNAQNVPFDHTEVNGLITESGPPPIWATYDYSATLIPGEVVVLLVASGIGYWRTHPRPKRSARRKAELQPIVDPEDQVEPD